jgi:hypothetical protein
MTGRNGSRNVSDDTIVDLRGEIQALRNEVGSLRSQLGRITGSERGPVPAMPQITTPGPEPYDMDPLHDQAVIDALTRGDDPRPAIRLARERISAEITARGGRPAAVSEFELADLRRRGDGHEQRRALAAAGIDLTDIDARGGVISRHESGQQVTVSHARTATCPSGHPAEPGHNYCQTCGSAIARPELGEDWPSEDRAARDREALQRAGLIGAEEG